MEKIDWNQRYTDEDTPWDSGIPSEELKRFVQAGLIKPCRVLEIGCGTGTNAIYLSKLGFEVTAVDLSCVALEQAHNKSKDAGVKINFLQSDIANFTYDFPPFPFVFDRGTYHVVRHDNLKGFQSTLRKMVAPEGLYLVLAGNPNEDAPPEKGPPRVSASDLCNELEFDSFDLINLEETSFHGITLDGQAYKPLAWKALLRRRHEPRK